MQKLIVSSFLRNLGSPNYIFEITSEESMKNIKTKMISVDPLFDQAVDLISREQKLPQVFTKTFTNRIQ